MSRKFDTTASMVVQTFSTGVNLKYVSLGMFYNCNNLAFVSVPNAKTVDGMGFYNCSGLRRLSLVYAVTIYRNSFENCVSLESVNLTSLRDLQGDCHFMNCVSLKVVDIQHVQHVDVSGSNIFPGCASLEIIFLPSDVPSTFSDDVFLNTGRRHKSNGAVDITVCLPSASSSFSGRWKYLDVSVPENYAEICGGSVEEDSNNDTLLMSLSIAGTVLFVGVVITAIVVLYNRKRMAAIRENTRQIELTKIIFDDFG